MTLDIRLKEFGNKMQGERLDAVNQHGSHEAAAAALGSGLIMAAVGYTSLGILATAAVIVPVIVLRSHHGATRRAEEQAEEAAAAATLLDVPPP